MALVGTIEYFRPGKDDFNNYMERMDMLFKCNGIDNTDEGKRVALFITLIGPDVYNTLQSLSPKTPAEISFDVIVATLKKHLAPEKSVIAERFAFYKAQQQEGQSILEFIVEIRDLAKSCDFKLFLGEALRDKLACGLKSEVIQRKLLSESKLTFPNACTTATSMEQAEKQARLLHPMHVNKINPKKGQSSKYNKESKDWKPKYKPCYRCERNMMQSHVQQSTGIATPAKRKGILPRSVKVER